MTARTLLELQDEVLARTFVGRTRELAIIEAALDAVAADATAMRMVVVHGSGGIGKTALRRMGARMARARGFEVVEHDADVRTPDDAADATSALIERLGASTSTARRLIVLDGFDRSDWAKASTRRALLGALRRGTVCILGLRNEPTAGWKAEPGWGTLIAPLPLGPLGAEDVADYLRRRGVDPRAHAELTGFARGNPLVLALLVDAQLRSPEVLIRIAHSPDLLTTLCEELVSTVPDPEHGLALEVATLLRSTTEGAIAALVSEPRATTLFRWLRELSFMETSARGIHPHDLAREILDRTFAWRNPRGRESLVRKVRAYLVDDLAADGVGVYDTFAQLGHLIPQGSDARKVVNVPSDFVASPAPARPEHLPAIVVMTKRHEGAESARLVERWYAHSPHAFRVLTDSSGDLLGFTTIVFLDRFAPDELHGDPVIVAARRVVDEVFRGPAVGRVSIVRYWMGRDSYQTPGPVTAALSAITVGAVLADDVALSFNRCADEQSLRMAIEGVGAKHYGHVTVGDHTSAFFGIDRRGLTAQEWMASMPVFTPGDRPAEAETSGAPLAREAFDEAVRNALRELSRNDRLAKNPLALSRLVSPKADAATTLRAAICEAMATVQDSPGRALRAAYGDSGRTHEAAAEAIGLPYSTFRRHVARGIDQLIDELWRREAAPRAK